jgi:hypothetical protein
MGKVSQMKINGENKYLITIQVRISHYNVLKIKINYKRRDKALLTWKKSTLLNN